MKEGKEVSARQVQLTKTDMNYLILKAILIRETGRLLMTSSAQVGKTVRIQQPVQDSSDELTDE